MDEDFLLFLHGMYYRVPYFHTMVTICCTTDWRKSFYFFNNTAHYRVFYRVFV